MILKIKNRQELSDWMHERRNHTLVSTKGRLSEFANLSDKCSLVNVLWRDQNTGETFHVEYCIDEEAA